MQLLTYGLWVATGVIEEKASRVIEILLSAITPRDLLADKVLGLGSLAFALYACLYAAAGALVSRQEDVQAPTTPLTILILGGYLLSFQILDDPSSTLAKVTSLIPLFSPLLMPVRMAIGEASAIEAIVAAVLLVISIGTVIRIGARIYERAVLRMGTPLGWREALTARAR